MKHFNKYIFFILITPILILTLCGCGQAEVSINYYVDGNLSVAPPDHNFYDVKSVETDNDKINVTWDTSAWSLTYDDAKKDTQINVYFTYTNSPFKINGVGYKTLQDAFASVTDSNPVTIETTADFEGFAATPIGSDITLNLNGFTLNGAGFDTITCNGTLTINGEGTITNTVLGEYSKSLVNYGNLTLNNIIIENTTANVSVWNSNNGGSIMNINECTITRDQIDCIVVINSGEMYINSGSITGAGDKTHPVVYNNADIAVLNLNGGTITNTGDGYDVYKDEGEVIVNGTEFTNPYGIDMNE